MNLIDKIHELAGMVGVWFDEEDFDIANAFHFEPEFQSVQVEAPPEVIEPTS